MCSLPNANVYPRLSFRIEVLPNIPLLSPFSGGRVAKNKLSRDENKQRENGGKRFTVKILTKDRWSFSSMWNMWNVLSFLCFYFALCFAAFFNFLTPVSGNFLSIFSSSVRFIVLRFAVGVGRNGWKFQIQVSTIFLGSYIHQ